MKINIATIIGILLAVIFIIIFISIVINLDGTDNTNPFEGLNYVFEEARFGLNLSEGWYIHSEEFNRFVQFDKPFDDNNYTSIVIGAPDPRLDPYQQTINFSELAIENIEFYRNNAHNFILLANDSIMINNMGAYEVEYEFCSEEVDCIEKTKLKYIFVNKDNRLY